jgi:hypothetical protein
LQTKTEQAKGKINTESMGILQTIDNTLADLREKWPESQKNRREAVDLLLASRLKLLRAKLEGIRTHRHITLSRLKLTGNVLRNLVSLSIFRQQKEIKFEKLSRQRTLSLEISNEEERRETQRAQKDLEIMLETRKQTTMAIIGIIFLPGAFISVSVLLACTEIADISLVDLQHDIF